MNLKIKKLLTTFVLIISLLSFSQSAFAASFTPITWSTSIYDSDTALYCNDLFKADTFDDRVYLYLTSSTWCDVTLIGTTNVSNVNQLQVNWDTESWDSGMIPSISLEIRYDDGYEYFDIPSYGAGTTTVNMGGYSGPVEVTVNCTSDGGKRINANFYIGVQ